MGRNLEPVLTVRRSRHHPRLELGRAPHLLGPLRDHALETGDARAVLHLQAAAAQVVDHQQVELRRADRLDVVGVRAMLEGRRPELRVVDSRDHDHRRVRPDRPQLLEQLVTRLVGQANVEQRDRVLLALHQLARLGPAEGHVAIESAALQRPGHDPRQRLLVVDHEHPLGGSLHAHGRESRRAKVASLHRMLFRLWRSRWSPVPPSTA